MRNVFLFVLLLNSLAAISQVDYFVSTKKTDSFKKGDLSEEQLFVKENFKYINMAEWKRGMPFMVVAKPGIIDTSMFISKNGKRISDYWHQILTVDTVIEKEVPCPKGSCLRTYVVFKANDGNVLEHEYIGSKEDLRAARTFNVIPEIAYIKDVDSARELLINRVVYVMKRIANVDTERGAKRVFIKKYMPCKIKSVGIGTAECPVKIILEDVENKEIYFELIFSGVNSGSINPVFGDGRFSDTFSFSNPRLKYKDISDSDWELIMNAKVRIGMTQKACQLSYGDPKDINTTTGNLGKHEQWVYNGSYLYFENGILTQIQD